MISGEKQAQIQDQIALRKVIYCISFTIIGWIFYVILMTNFPKPFADDSLRAIVRVSLMLLPALFCAYYQKNQSLTDYFHLRQNWLKGWVLGIGITTVYLLALVVLGIQNLVIKPPTEFSTWFNYIIGSPFAEELLFRGILFKQLSLRMDSWKAMALSSTLFAIFHIPVWLFLDHYTWNELFFSYTQIFVYGLIFAALFRISHSLWAPLTVHWLNNLILSMIVNR